MDFTSKDILHIKKNGVEYLSFKILKEFGVNNYITLRFGGVSSAEYNKSLNFRYTGLDTKENVLKNLDIIKKEANIKNDIYKAMQAHTDKILVINKDNMENYRFENFCNENYDGYVVNEKGIYTLVTTADCNPIILYDKKNNVYANIHSGWMGTIKKIYLNAFKIMQKRFGTNAEDLIVCVGPSINKCCFTSKEESFKKKFTDVFENEQEYLYYEKDKETFHIDMPYLIKRDFINLGANKKNIILSNICTKCNTKYFFSARDSRQKGYEDFGTFATIVGI